jgi:NDP-sugar pyrophosphorylase family protein
MNGDIVTSLDFLRLVDFARQNDYDLTVGYVHRTYQSPYGVLTIDKHEVVGITEKPQLQQCVSSGIYVLKGSALDLIPDNEFYTIPDLIHKLQSHSRPVGAYYIEEFWLGIEELGHLEKVRDTLNVPDAGRSE